MRPCFLSTWFKSGWREIGLCHRCYNVPCQKQEAIFFFGTIRQIMRQLNIGHFILISQTNEGWYIWPENASVFLIIYFCVCVRERKQMNVNFVCSVLILFIFLSLSNKQPIASSWPKYSKYIACLLQLGLTKPMTHHDWLPL